MTWQDCSEAADLACCKDCGKVLGVRDGIAALECWTCRSEGRRPEVLGPEHVVTAYFELRNEGKR